MTVRVSLACVGLCVACANPNPSTLNQKCFDDEHCNPPEVCVKADGESAGFCRDEDEVPGPSSSGAGTTVSPTSTSSTGPTVDPTLTTAMTSTGMTSPLTSSEEGSTSEDPSTGSTGEPGCDGVPTPDLVSYAAASTLATAANPQGVAVGDLDGDGELDIAVTSIADDTIQTFLGDGFGNFALADTGMAGTSPAEVVLGAIADATVDAVVEQSSGGQVRRLQGNGDGSFGNAQTGGQTSGAIALVDVDGDDILDLLGADAGLTVALGSAVGESFGAVVEYPTGLSTTSAEIAIGDFDGNGLADAVVGGGSFELVLLLGNGAGSFNAQAVRNVAGVVFDVAVGDFDGDAQDDVVAITAGGGTDAVRVFFGNGDGTLAAKPEILATQTSPMRVAAGDMDADGDDDIFVTHIGGALGITTSNGDGSFAGEQVLNCDNNPRGLEVGYINDDCVLDIVSVSSTSEVVCLWLST